MTFNALGQSLFAYSATVFVHSALVLLVGIVAARLLRRYGPLLQSHVLRTALLACALVLIIPLVASRASQPRYQVSPSKIDRMAVQMVVQTASAKETQAVVTASGPGTVDITATSEPSASRPSSVEHLTLIEYLTLTGALGTLWLIGVTVQLLLVAGGWLYLRKLKRESTAVTSAAVQATLTRLADRLFVKAPALRESPWVDTPFLAGVLRPTIYLREGFCEAATQIELETALLHELAHVRRGDTVWAILARMTSCFLWIQPLIWIAVRRSAQAVEEATDQLALQQGIASSDYAACLLQLAKTDRTRQRRLMLSVGIVEADSSIGTRIKRILSPAEKAVRRVSIRLRIGSLALALGIPIAALSLVAFTDPTGGVLKSLAGGLLPQDQPITWTPPAGYVDQFKLPQEQGWPVAIARYRSGATPDGQRLTQSDRQMIAQVNVLVGNSLNTFYGSGRPPRTTLDRLITFCSKNPGNFYAEQALAGEYRLQGDMAKYNEWEDRALRDAPFILAGRFQYEDGRPFTPTDDQLSTTVGYGARLPGRTTGSVAGYRVWPDANGCYYLPAFRTDADLQGLGYASPMGSVLSSRTIGESVHLNSTIVLPDSKVVLMPPQILRPRIMLQLNVQGKGDSQNPLIVNGDTLTLRWKPVPQAARYAFQFVETEFNPPAGEGSVHGMVDPTVPDSAHTSLDLHLDSPDFVFWPGHLYQVSVNAYRADGAYLSSSNGPWFRPRTWSKPLALTRENVAKILPSNARLDSLVKDPQGRTSVTVSTPEWPSPPIMDALERRFMVFPRFRESGAEWTTTSSFDNRTLYKITIPR